MNKEPMSDRLRGEVQNNVMLAGAIDPSVTDRFYDWADGEVHEDPATREAVGLELLPDFKAAHPALFKPPEQPVPSKKAKRIIVDEDREVNIPIGISSYTFRPGQTLNDPYIIELAREHKIATREK
jgi:hypothetical protein